MAVSVTGRKSYFTDRHDAGRQLGAALVARKVHYSAILGLTRGGVPVAFEVARQLRAPLDILVVKKLRAPSSPELAIGAICADGTKVLHEEFIRELGVSQDHLEREVAERWEEARQADQRYRGGIPALAVANTDVLIVDDGIATGATMEAAVLWASTHGARRVGVAIPVGSREACFGLRAVAADVFCMTTPLDFWAVGQFYLHFEPVADQEVARLLRESHASSWQE